MYFLDPRRAGLKFGDLRCRIEGRIRQLVCRQLFAPMIWYEYRVAPDRFDDQGREDAFAATRDNFHRLAIGYLVFHGSLGMDLNKRFGALLVQKADPPWLIAG